MPSPFPVLKHPLAVVQPLRHSPAIKEVQALLARNRFADFDPGAEDGQWGEHSAAATRRAQYWLGHRRLDGVMRQGLIEQLAGVNLTKLQHGRRLARIARRAMRRLQNPGRQAFHVALHEVGVKENPPNSNRGHRVDEYQASTGAIGEPWCASFVSWCLDQIGWKRDRQHVNWAYCPSILAAAHQGIAGLSITHQPREGDLVLYDWDHDGVADHVEFFGGWISHGTTFSSVGGNTGPSNASNGGQVYHYPTLTAPARTTSLVAAFVRIHPA